MKLTPKLIPGSLHHENKGACDWGWQSMFAYGCHNFVVVVDPETVQVIQTLDLHQSNVVKVKWCRENYHHDLACPYILRLASADATGHVIIWDVNQGISLSEFSEGSKPVLDLNWLWTQDASHDLLAALHAPSSLVLWNVDTGMKLWKKTLLESLLCFAFDPFSPSKVTLMSQEYLVFLSDFSVNQPPESDGRRFYMTSSDGNASSTGGSTNLSSSGNNDNSPKRPSKSAFQRVKVWAANESKTRAEEVNVALSECLQLVYHPSCRHLILLVFPREILFIDTDINQAIGSIYLERNNPSFVHAVIPCTQRDVIFTLHENGSITMRCRRQMTNCPYPADATGLDNDESSADIVYENRCQSDTFRFSKSSNVSGFVACPVTETRLILLVSDGRVLIWNLRSTNEPTSEAMLMSDECLKASLPLSSSEAPLLNALNPPPQRTLADMLPLSIYSTVSVKGALRFLLVGLLTNVHASPTSATMCPPMTTKNLAEYRPLVAVGNSSGSVQVFDLSVGLMMRDFSLHSAPVKGVVWSSLKNFLSWSHWSHSSSVRSEVFVVDLNTGHHTLLPLSKNSGEKTVMSIKVSQLKQYFTIVYKEKPLEIWDLKNLSLLREMSTHFPLISALEWSPSHYSKHRKKSKPIEDKSGASEGSEEKAANVLDSGKPDVTTIPAWVREHFIFTNTDGMLFHYVVDGSSVKDSTKVPPDGSMGNITSITWKGDTVILGDSEGNMSIWDLRNRLSRNQSTHRGSIKKMKFAPGRGNVKIILQFSDGVEIWDLGKSERTSSLKTQRDSPSVVDIEWFSSEVPLLLFSNGTMRMMDMQLKRSCSSMSEQDLTDSLCCPHLLPPKKALMFKSILQSQSWNGKYTLDVNEINLVNQEKKDQVTELLSVIPDDIKDFLPEAPLGVSQRCLLAAQLYGDEGETKFWNVTLHYLRREKCRMACPAHRNSSGKTSRSSSRIDHNNPADSCLVIRRRTGSLDLLSIDDDLDLNTAADSDNEQWEPCFCFPLSLDPSYDILCDPQTFQKHQLNRVALHDSKRLTYEHTKKCAETLVLLKQSDRAVQLFLETEPVNKSYYNDSLRACLVAAIRSSGASQSTIKLVATNLIANGKLDEGVQLLCMIDKGIDACRYLQTYGKWDQAAWLAKATLDYKDCVEVMRRWVEHLSGTQISQQSRGLLLYISLGQFKKALLMIFGMRFFDRAALFAEACMEYGLLPTEDASVSLLLESVFTEYARYLYTIGLINAAKYYCSKGGLEGQRLLQDIS